MMGAGGPTRTATPTSAIAATGARESASSNVMAIFFTVMISFNISALPDSTDRSGLVFTNAGQQK
jgi:hypothetical protein